MRIKLRSIIKREHKKMKKEEEKMLEDELYWEKADNMVEKLL
jgi:hypothetical protein